MYWRRDGKRPRTERTESPGDLLESQNAMDRANRELVTALREANVEQRNLIAAQQTSNAALRTANAVLRTANATLQTDIAAAAAAHNAQVAEKLDTIDGIMGELNDALIRIETLEAESEPTDSESDSDDDAVV